MFFENSLLKGSLFVNKLVLPELLCNQAIQLVIDDLKITVVKVTKATPFIYDSLSYHTCVISTSESSSLESLDTALVHAIMVLLLKVALLFMSPLACLS